MDNGKKLCDELLELIETPMVWEVGYTVLANNWFGRRTVHAVTEAGALARFEEYWTRDGSSLDELATYSVVSGPMKIDS